MASRISVSTFSEKQLANMIKMLAGPRGEQGQGRFQELHRRIRRREQHFFNTKEADQKLPSPYDDIEPYQIDALRDSWVDLKSRLIENAWRVRIVPPKETIDL